MDGVDEVVEVRVGVSTVGFGFILLFWTLFFCVVISVRSGLGDWRERIKG